MTIEEIEDAVDASILDAYLNECSIDDISSLATGFTSWYYYQMDRRKALANHGFLQYNNDKHHLSTKIMEAFDSGLFESAMELFHPNSEQESLMKLWDITYCKVLD